MAMMHGVTLTCLLSLICYIAAVTGNSNITTTEGTNTTGTTLVTSIPSSSVTSAEPQTLPTTELMSTSKQNLANGSTTSTSSSGSEGASMTSTDTMFNTTLSTNSSTISMTSEISSLTEKNMSTTEMQTSLANTTFVTTSSPVNMTGTITEAPTTQTAATAEMLANNTVNVTQTSTLEHTTIIATPHNASTGIPATSRVTTITASTAVSFNETSTVVTLNITSTNTSATTETNANVTVPVTVTVTMNATSEVTTQSTEISNSSWSTTPSPNPADHCANANCPPDSKCVNLFSRYVCLCPPGFFEQGNSCITARIFPGILHLKNVSFTDDMNDKSSKAFSDTANTLEKEMKAFFKDNHSYYKSIVQKLEKGSVEAFVDNIFARSSNATVESITTSIENGIKDCVSCKLISPSDSYIAGSICNQNPCDIRNSECKANNGIFICNCRPGYYKFAASDRSCQACGSGFKLENGACVKCPFGYGGFNCNNSYLLAVVVISCVLGGLLLLLLLALIATCLRSKSGSYSSSSGTHDYVMWPKSEMPKIPRATMHWEGNQLEMQENGSTSSLTDIHRDGGRTPEKNDDLKTFKGKQQSRYTYLCQGQENPYYVSDEKKPEYL